MNSVSLIGAGINNQNHVNALRQIKGIEIAGVCTQNLNSANNFKDYNSLKFATDDIEELYEKSESKFLIVSVPVDKTFEVAKKVSNYPWKILFEKPLGLNYGEALDLKEMLYAGKSKNYVGLNRRFYQINREILKIINLGKQPLQVNIYDCESLDSAKKSGHSKQVLDNWAFANAIHIIDLGRYYCGDSVSSVNSVPFKKNSELISIKSEVIFNNGSKMNYFCNWKEFNSWKIEIFSGGFTAIISPLEKVKITHENREFTYSESEYFPYSLCKPGYLNQAMHFTEKSEDVIFKLVSTEESLETMNLIRQIYEF